MLPRLKDHMGLIFPQTYLIDEWRSLSDDFWKTVREVAGNSEPLTPFTPKPHQQPPLMRLKYFLKDKRIKVNSLWHAVQVRLIGFWTAVDVLKPKQLFLVYRVWISLNKFILIERELMLEK